MPELHLSRKILALLVQTVILKVEIQGGLEIDLSEAWEEGYNLLHLVMILLGIFPVLHSPSQ